MDNGGDLFDRRWPGANVRPLVQIGVASKGRAGILCGSVAGLALNQKLALESFSVYTLPRPKSL